MNLVDADFSNHVLGRIFIDTDDNLSLAIAPSTSKWEEGKQFSMTREVLMENVENIKYSFFTAPKKGESRMGGPEPRGSWIQTWNQEYNELPVLVQIEIGYKNEEETKTRTMVFPLPNGKHTIVYDK